MVSKAQKAKKKNYNVYKNFLIFIYFIKLGTFYS